MTELSKMDPMARKLGAEVESFHKAIDSGDVGNARHHINEIQKFAQFLANDIASAVAKSENTKGVNDIYAGGAPVMQFNTILKTHPVSNDVLPGMIRTNRTGHIMRRLSNRTV